MKWTMKSFLATALVLGLAPAAGAVTFATTAFVPELATSTVDVTFRFHDRDIDELDLNSTSLGVRLSYVPYPALETSVGLRFLSYDLEGFDKEGLGVEGGAKYQFTQAFRSLDVAMALLGSYGHVQSIDEWEVAGVGLVSRDISSGWTPFAGLGASWARQEFAGTTGLPAAEEDDVAPVFFVGAKYLFKNTFGLVAETFFQDGLGAEVACSIRF